MQTQPGIGVLAPVVLAPVNTIILPVELTSFTSSPRVNFNALIRHAEDLKLNQDDTQTKQALMIIETPTDEAGDITI